MGERIRIRDIAEELGLSTATVSNVIHGKTKKISKETVKRVQELLEKRGYIPSMAAVLLAQNDSRIIGIVVNNHPKYEDRVLEDPFISSSLNALSIEIERAGYFMMVKTTVKWNDIIRYASMWNMEGLILIGFCENDYKLLRDNMHIPFVVYDGYFEENHRICNLFVDNYGGGFEMGDYLYRMGHRNVLCIADNYSYMDKERIAGCRAGMKGGKTNFLQVPMTKEERMCFYERHLEEILTYHTAVFAVSDMYAIELMLFLQQRKISVPDDISIAGFDNIPMCENVFPGLTTIGQDVGDRAKRAMAALKELKERNCENPFQILPVQLVVRGSVRRIKNGEGSERGRQAK